MAAEDGELSKTGISSTGMTGRLLSSMERVLYRVFFEYSMNRV